MTALIRGSSNKEPGGPYRKPRADFYTVALVLALIAIILAILCLWLLMLPYDKQIKGGPVPTFSAQTQPADALALVFHGRLDREEQRLTEVPSRPERPWHTVSV